MISVLCPSRGHPDLLAKSVQSLRDLANGRPEILVGADADDSATLRAAIELGTVTQVFQRAGYARLHVYYQGLASTAKGNWLLIWNDDSFMTAAGWDSLLESLPPEIMVADLVSTHSPLCCFPAIRRKAVNIIGRFSSDNPHVDTFWGEVGERSGTIAKVLAFVHTDTPSNPTMQTHGFYSRHTRQR